MQSDDSDDLQVSMFAFEDESLAAMFALPLAILAEMQGTMTVRLDGCVVEVAGDPVFMSWLEGRIALKTEELGCEFTKSEVSDAQEVLFGNKRDPIGEA